jgi:arabinofuranosyltransferase
LELTRPDGLLFGAATFLAVAAEAAKERGAAARLRAWAQGAPLLFIVVHELWRRATYGAWLPNTYHAKYVAPWPEAGLRYAYCFILENGLWVPLAALGIAWARRRRRPPGAPPAAAAAIPSRAAARIAAGALVLHLAYYTLIIGGDHFEYRVFAHVLPLGCVAFAWALASFAVPPRAALAAIAASLVASWPIPWTHWALSRRVVEPGGKFLTPVAVAPAFPRFLAAPLESFDRNQARLLEHYICARQANHAAFWRSLVDGYPAREEGARISGEGYPVLVASAVGVVSWVLPHVNILDASGLNDFVVARMPPPPGRTRAIAHERAITGEYVSDYRPNVAFDGKKVVVSRRARPLTAEDIHRAEEKWRARVEGRGDPE